MRLGRLGIFLVGAGIGAGAAALRGRDFGTSGVWDEVDTWLESDEPTFTAEQINGMANNLANYLEVTNWRGSVLRRDAVALNSWAARIALVASRTRPATPTAKGALLS